MNKSKKKKKSVSKQFWLWKVVHIRWHAHQDVNKAEKLRGSLKGRWRARRRKGLSDISHGYGSDPAAGAPTQSPPAVKDDWRWVWIHSAAVFEHLCHSLSALSTVRKHKRVCVCVGLQVNDSVLTLAKQQRPISALMLTSLRRSHHLIAWNTRTPRTPSTVSARPPLRTFTIFAIQLNHFHTFLSHCSWWSINSELPLHLSRL